MYIFHPGEFIMKAAVQYVYLDFDGESTVYNGELLTIDQVVVQDSSLPQERISNIVAELNRIYAAQNVIFVTERPATAGYSTIFVGKTSAFDQYGSFAGLAETIDEGNAIKNDNAFVMLDSSDSDEAVISAISHETGHLLGTLTHPGNGVDAYALLHSVQKGDISVGAEVNGRDSMYIYSGGVAVEVTVAGNEVLEPYNEQETAWLYVYDGGCARDVYAKSGSYIEVKSGGHIDGLKVVSQGFIEWDGKAQICIRNGGSVEDVSISVFVSISVESGGVIDGLRFDHMGDLSLTAYAGAVFKGEHSYNSSVTLLGSVDADEADIIFDISDWSYASNPVAIVNNIAYLDAAGYSIMVSDLQSNGTYLLAGNAANFNSSVALVSDTGKNYGTLSVGGEVEVENKCFTLQVNSGRLELVVAPLYEIDPDGDEVQIFCDYELIKEGSVLSGESLPDYSYSMKVNANGTANSTYLADGASMQIQSGGVANSTSAYDAEITCRGRINDTGLYASTLNLIDGGSAKNTTVKQDGIFEVTDYSFAADTEVEGGKMIVGVDGSANNITVGNGGVLEVKSEIYSSDCIYHCGSGSACNISILDGGSAEISSDVENLIVFAGGSANLSYGFELNPTWWEAFDIPEDYNEPEFFEYAGKVVDGEVKYGAELSSDSGTTFAGNIIFGGTITLDGVVYTDEADIVFDLRSRKTTDSYIVNDIHAVSGAKSFTVTVNPFQQYGDYKIADQVVNQDKVVFDRTITVDCGTVLAPAISIDGSVTYNGRVYSLHNVDNVLVFRIAEALIPVPPDQCSKKPVELFKNNQLFAVAETVTGKELISYNESLMHIHDQGSAFDTVVNAGGKVEVFNGGNAEGTLVNADGMMAVYSGGSADESEIAESGTLEVAAGGEVTGTVIYGDASFSGGSGAGSEVFGYLLVENSGSAANSTVSGLMEVEDASVSVTEIRANGSLVLYDNAAALNTVIAVDGSVEAYSGAMLTNTTVAGQGSLFLAEGARHTGTLTLDSAANVSAESGAVIDFDIRGRSSSSPALVTNWSVIAGNPDYTVTVSASQAYSTYTLASGAAGFNDVISVYCDNLNLGSVSLDQDLKVNGTSYALELNAGNLLLTTGKFVPDTEKPVISVVTLIQGEHDYRFTASWVGSDNVSAKQDMSMALGYAETRAQLPDGTSLVSDSFTLSPSDAGKEFYFKLVVRDEAGNAAEKIGSFKVRDVTAPVFNGGVSYHFTEKRDLILSWNKAVDNVAVDQYVVQHGGRGIAVLDSSKTSLTITDPDAAENCVYSVCAVDAAGNFTKISTSEFTIPAREDLQIASVVFRQNGRVVTEIDEDTPVDVTVTVKNEGSFHTGIFDLTLQYGGETLTRQITDMAPGQVEHTFSIGNIAEPGSLTFTAAVDPGNRVHEADENNNTASADLTVNQVDLLPPVIAESDYRLIQSEKSYKFTWQVSAEDNSNGALTYRYFYSFDQSTLFSGQGLTQNSFTLAPEDYREYIYHGVIVTDQSGNTARYAGHLAVVDYTAPELDGDIEFTENGKFVTFRWSAGSDNHGILRYLITVNGKTTPVYGATEYTMLKENSGSYDCSVQAEDFSGNLSSTLSGSWQLNQELPDLAFESVGFEQDGNTVSIVDLSRPFKCLIKIKNQGNAASGEVTGKVFWGERGEEFSIAGITPGETLLWEKNFDPGAFTSGNHTIRVELDSNDSASELDEENNVKELVLKLEETSLCDLTVSRLTTSASEVVYWSPLRSYRPMVLFPEIVSDSGNKVFFEVCNSGASDSGSATAEIMIKDASGVWQLLGNCEVPALKQGEQSVISWAIPDYELTKYEIDNLSEIKVEVNGDRAVKESNHANNSKSISIFYMPSKLADIEVTDAVLLTPVLPEDKTALLNVTVANNGAADAGEFDITILAGNSVVGSGTVSALKAGENHSLQIRVDGSQLIAGNDYILEVDADYKNVLVESDEDNNIYTSLDLALKVPDLPKVVAPPVFTADPQISQQQGSYLFTITAAATDDSNDALTYEYRRSSSLNILNSATYQKDDSFTLGANYAGKDYYFQVRVSDSAGNKTESKVMTVKVQDFTAPEINAKAVTAKNTSTGLLIDWSKAVSDNVGITRCNLYVDGKLYKENTTARSCLVQGLSAGTSHTWQLEAFDAAGLSAITAQMPVDLADITAPVIESWKMSQIEGTYKFRFDINATDNVTAAKDLSYKIQYSFNDPSFREDRPLYDLAADNTFTFAETDAGKVLYVWSYVFDAAGNKNRTKAIATSIKDYTLPSIPQNPVSSVSDQSVRLSWEASTDNCGKIYGYRIRISDDPDKFASMTLKDYLYSAKNFTDYKGVPGKYYWQVAACDNYNTGEWSDMKVFHLLAADPYENNDSIAAAADLGSLNGTTQIAGTTLGNPSDADWFKFIIPTMGKAGDYIELIPENAGLNGAVLQLYDASGKQLIREISADGGAETLSLKDIARGTYLLRVSSSDRSTGKYQLICEKNNGVAADEYEENDNFRSATVLDLSRNPAGNLAATIDQTKGTDVDYYRIDLDHAGTANDFVKIDLVNSSGDLDIFLYDSTGEKVVMQSATNQNTEGLSLARLASGAYYIKVAGASDEIQNQYTLSWQVKSVKVTPDAFEGAEPISISNGDTKNLTISPDAASSDKADNFKFTIRQGKDSKNKLVFSGEIGRNLNYTIKDSGGKQVLNGTTRSGTVRLQTLAAGEYTLTVDSSSEVYGEYSLHTELAAAAGSNGKKQAVLLYVAADNNGHNRFLYALAQLQRQALPENVELYVLLDRSGDEEYFDVNDFDFANWSGTKFCKLQYLPNDTDPSAQGWLDWGELNTASVDTLKRFIDTSMSMAQADQYTLMIFNHGSLSGGIAFDENSSSHMKTSDLAGLLKNYSNIPVVGFDACLMGSEHVVTSMQGACDYLVAFESKSYSLDGGIIYTDMLKAIRADMSAEEIAQTIVNTAKNDDESVVLDFPFLKDGKEVTSLLAADHTVVLYDVSAPTLQNALNAFGESSKNFTAADWQALVQVYGKAASYGSCYSNLDMQYSDLLTIMENIAVKKDLSASCAAAVKSLISEVKKVVKNCVSVPNDFGTSFSTFNPVISDAEAIRYYGKLHQGLELDKWDDYVSTLAENAVNVGISSENSVLETIPLWQTGAVAGNLGFFYGNGVTFTGLSVAGEECFTFDSLTEFAAGDAIICKGQGITLTLLDQEMNQLALSENGVIDLKGIKDPEGKYILQVTSAQPAEFSLSFGSATVSGTDRFDYAGTFSYKKGANGNGTLQKATLLQKGFYSGLVTYAGDSDWYAIEANADSRCFIRVAGKDLAVGAYDSAGNLTAAAEYVDGEYILTMPETCFLRVEGSADIDSGKINNYSVKISTITGASAALGTSSGLSWNSGGSSGSFVVALKDSGKGVLSLAARNNALDFYGLPDREFSWSAESADSTLLASAQVNNDSAVSSSGEVFESDFDGNTDLFFASGKGVWGKFYSAQHSGYGSWQGTGEEVNLTGKNIIADFFMGSPDSNVLVLTDESNGDALFVDDIYTALPGSVAEQQSRIARIGEIRAGAGDDVVDLTSQKFTYVGEGVKVYGGSGNDTIWANKGRNILFGDGGNDRIAGGSNNDVITGGIGNDSMHGGGGDDIFCFGGNWGKDTITQLANGSVTLWFEDGDKTNWNASTLTYTDGTNSVKVTGIAADRISLKFGGDTSDLPSGAFAEAASEKIFEDKDKGMLA